MADNLPRTSPELDRYITASGENDHIDAKGPLTWDGGVTSASLAKHFAAFANSRDGGVIVIGKSELESGEFDLTGLSEEQAKSFETTKVAKWVNGYFSPPISLICHHHEYEDKRFVIVTISEFADVPSLCTKSYQDPDNAKKHILRERSIYVRNPHAESEPLGSPDDLRALIGIATSKRRDELVKMFDSITKGRPLLNAPTYSEQFDEELRTIEAGLGSSYEDQVNKGGWWLLVRPSTFDDVRWDDNAVLESIIDRRAARLFDEFPPTRNGTHVREWGICNDFYGEIWTLARSGQFICIRPFVENERHYKANWISSQPEPELAPRKWLEFRTNLMRIYEMMLFASRFAEEYWPGERIEMVLRATGLAGRKLVTSDMKIFIRRPEECRAATFEFKKNLGVEEFRAEWEDICADAMKRFVEYFPSIGGRVELSTMRNWVTRFKNREF